MSTVTEVTEILPKLTTDELQQVEDSLIRIYRERRQGIIFDDAYGVLTERDLAAAQEETLRLIDGPPVAR